MNDKAIEKLLRGKNVSVTENRIRIVKCLMDSHHFHTIHEISEHSKGINTKSIYNNIKVLIDAGIVDSYSFAGISKFALNDDLFSEDEIHIVNKEDVSHLKIDKQIFKDIKNSATSKGFKVKNIKIFVEVE